MNIIILTEELVLCHLHLGMYYILGILPLILNQGVGKKEGLFGFAYNKSCGKIELFCFSNSSVVLELNNLL